MQARELQNIFKMNKMSISKIATKSKRYFIVYNFKSGNLVNPDMDIIEAITDKFLMKSKF